MNLRKFTAANTRECLRQMREALGPEAMIVSTRKTPEGVEIIGASAEDIAQAEQHAPVAASGFQKVLARQRDAAGPTPESISAPGSSPAPEAGPWDAELQDEPVRLSPAARALAAQSAEPKQRPAEAIGAGVPEVLRQGRRPLGDLQQAQTEAMRAAARRSTEQAPQTKLPDLGNEDMGHFVRREPEVAPRVVAQPEESELARHESSHAVPMPQSNPSISSRVLTGEEAKAGVPQGQSVQPQRDDLPGEPLHSGFVSQTEAELLRALGMSLPDPEPGQMGSRIQPTADQSAPVMNEVRAMRQWLEQQMLALTWRDATQRNPNRRLLWRQLVDAGFTPMLARAIVSHLPDEYSPEQADSWLKDVLTRNLNGVPEAEGIVEAGGVYALVGPTGVGKTTTTAKLAARCVVKYGAKSLGLITTDQYRIGAVDQLRTFGRILGVEVYTARGAADLETTLLSMGNRRLVLVDTVGMGQRDTRISEQVANLSVAGLNRVLVLPAGGHAEQCEDIVQAYGAQGLRGVIISKLDEAVRLGGVLDAVIRHKLALLAMTTGQRVPEDIHAPSVGLLIHRALKNPSSPLFALQDDEVEWSSMPIVDRGGSAPSGSIQRG